MNPNRRDCWRLAIIIHKQLEAEQSANLQVSLPADIWQQCESLQVKMRQSQQCGWQLAATRLARDLRSQLCLLQSELNVLDTALTPTGSTTYSLSASEVYADLVALNEEFSEVSIDPRKRAVCVTTEPIELHGIYFGPFEICLDWGNVSQGQSHGYRVIALDANPAATNNSVTHPHVQDESLCEGEGFQLIRKALEQGRLLDFFLIVANLLRTYNSDSPYVALSDWNGVQCRDCSILVDEDEQRSCEKCESIVCDDCYCRCFRCEHIRCSACISQCESCSEHCCDACMKQCVGCDVEFCQSCLDEKERCTDCHDPPIQREEQVIREEYEANACDTTSDAPLQPDCVGEAALPA